MAVVLFVGATAFLSACPLVAADTQDDVSALKQVWEEAVRYADSRHEAWNEIWTAFDVPADVAEAIVFPEMLRYSALQDRIETTAVSGTYVTLGSKGFDFSVGRFQMKPSFVERLEKRWMKTSFPPQLDAYFDTDDSRTARRVRLSRLYDELWQCVYVAMFIKLTYLDFQGLAELPIEEQVQLLATAYNHGVIATSASGGSMEQLRQWSVMKTFHLAIIPVKDTPRYSYAHLAWQRFQLHQASFDL